MKVWLFVAVALVAAGCSSGGVTELSPDKDKELRNNLNRALTPEEVAQMGKTKPPEMPTKK